MGKAKKVIAGVLVTALAVGGIYTGLNQVMKKKSQKVVQVTNVSSLVDSYYMPSTTLSGQVTTNVSQNITVDSDTVIKELYVSEGDEIRTGDPVVSFDLTLVEMELNIAKLKKQQMENELAKAKKRLTSLKNGGPIETDSYYDDNSLNGADNIIDPDEDDEDDDLAYNGTVSGGNYLAFAVSPVFAAAFTDVLEEEPEAAAEGDAFSGGETEIAEDSGTDSFEQGSAVEPSIEFQDPSVGEFTAGEDTSDGGFSSGEEPGISEDFDEEEMGNTSDALGITDGNPKFYQVLDYNSEPYTGKGTKDNPYVFLCSVSGERVRAMGSFFNKMAGYNENGTAVEKEGGSWFQLEFYNNDVIEDLQNRKASCIGYYLIDGSMLTNPVSMYSETEFTLEGASTFEPDTDEDPDDYGGDDYYDDTYEPSMTRSEAIKLQERRISELELDIKENDLDITKLEKRMKNEMIYSKLDGTVAFEGEAIEGASSQGTSITIKSKDGFYVQGTVSELMLDEMTEGTKLSCMSYEHGQFEAEVIEVSQYPVTGDSYGYYGDSNPNVSYYLFSANILDKDIGVTDMDYLDITLQSDTLSEGSLVMTKAFVRTDDGVSYVFKDDNGVLKKQIVKVGASVNGGYSITIKSGLTKEDKVAFPYGEDVVEGAKTKEVTLDEMYGY